MKDINMKVDIIKGGKSIYDNDYTTGCDYYSGTKDNTGILDIRDILTFRTKLYNFIMCNYDISECNEKLMIIEKRQYLYKVIQDINDTIILSILEGDPSFPVSVLTDWLRAVYVDDYTPKGKDMLYNFIKQQRRPNR